MTRNSFIETFPLILGYDKSCCVVKLRESVRTIEKVREGWRKFENVREHFEKVREN